MVLEELDGLAGGKDKQNDAVYSLVSQMDQMKENMIVIATTNAGDKVDKSIRRSGRLDLLIRMDMPSADDRYLILREHFKALPHKIDDFDLKMIARASSGFVSADIAQIVRNCHLRAIKAGRDFISKQDLEFEVLESKPLSI